MAGIYLNQSVCRVKHAGSAYYKYKFPRESGNAMSDWRSPENASSDKTKQIDHLSIQARESLALQTIRKHIYISKISKNANNKMLRVN